MTVQVTASSFGCLASGEEVTKYTLSNRNNFEVNVISYGASIQSILLHDKSQTSLNVALGFDSLKEYYENSMYCGATVGPVANRISNAEFTLDGVAYHLDKNNGNNCLHGGKKGFSWRNWVSDIIPNGVKFSLCSLDGEDGFPGEVWTECSYTLSSDSNDLIVEYTAVTDRPTPVDLTNHAYFNLNGHDSGKKVYNHTFKFAAETYLDFDPVEMTVTGKLNSVKGTKYDFSDEVKLADRVESGGKWPEEGYDNFFVVSNTVTDLKNVATVKNQDNGLVLNVSSNQNGFQFYTGNYIDIEKKYSIHDGFCIECHNLPDSVNKVSFPSSILHPDTEYKNKTVFSFSIDN